jgi:hypothetical protein
VSYTYQEKGYNHKKRQNAKTLKAIPLPTEKEYRARHTKMATACRFIYGEILITNLFCRELS